MTPLDALFELLARVGASKGMAVLVSEEELGHWPAVAVHVMKKQKLLVRSRPAASVVCPGCEQECVMQVHTPPHKTRKPESFVVCDRRYDINRVPIAVERLKQWRCDQEAVCEFIAQSLRVRRSEKRSVSTGLCEIGIVTGDKRSQMLCLKADGTLSMVAGNSSVPLSESIDYSDGTYLLNQALIGRMVDAATTADKRYSPTNSRREARKLDTEAMHESWKKQYRSLIKIRPGRSDVWYSQQIARMGIAKGRSAGTIRKSMKF